MGSSHSRATRAGHRASVSGRPQRRIEALTNYESEPSGTHQRQATAGNQATHKLRKRAIGHPSAVGHGEGSGHSQTTRAGHRAPVSRRPRRGMESLTNYESEPSGTRQRLATAGDGVTHLLQERAIGQRSAAGHGGGSNHSLATRVCHQAPSAAGNNRGSSHSLATKAGHRAPVSGRPRRGI